MTIELAKGVRDFPPEEKLLRNEITHTLQQVFEHYGFSPLETPAIERWDMLTAKFGAGDTSDAMKEVFSLTDQGERKLGLRFDLTVPLARFIANHPEIKFPFKRYQMEKVWRDGPIKLGRYREFWQCDCDVIGTSSILADTELLKLAEDAFKKIGLAVTLDVNNRKILNGFLETIEIPKTKRDQAIIIIDKMKKVDRRELTKEFENAHVQNDAIEKIFSFLTTDRRTNNDILTALKEHITSPLGQEGIKEMEELLDYAKIFGIKHIRFVPSLARGLAYYTGPVFEGFLNESEKIGITSSVCGGGRYDEMVGKYAGGKEHIPATGISFGLEPITEAIKKQGQLIRKTPTSVYVIPIGTVKECIPILSSLRHAGVNADMDISRRGISKNMQYANTYHIPFVLIIGEDELAKNHVKIRDMKSGNERMITINEATVFLKQQNSTHK
jgi:histidyl-tRNA synthetase